MNPKCLIIIPSFNEEKSLPRTLSQLKKSLNSNMDIVVINDGSSDRTGEIAEKENVSVIHLPYNMGIGAAMQTGYLYAHRYQYDIAIQLDADGQHPSNEIEHLIQDIVDNKSDMVIGSRFLQKTDYKGSFQRRFGILYFSTLLKLLTGKRFTDPTSGFRAVNKNIIEIFSQEYPSDYPEPEVLISLDRKGFRLTETTVNMLERQGGKSSITPIKSLYYMIKVTLSIMMCAFSKGEKK